MEWIVIIALGVWIFLQGQGLKELRRRLEAVERGTARLGSVAPPAAAPPPAPEPMIEEPHVEVLTPPLPVAAFDEPEPALEAALEIAAPVRASASRRSAAAWISEHGLAWLGGGALALGGLFLVAYAAQRGVFTPALRIAMAVALGLLMIGVSEWVRRRLDIGAARQAPASALLAGAGAATLYGAAWAAHRLYGYIELPAAAVLLALISAGLLGLALIHGAPLALAALFGAYLAPVVTNGPDWGDGPLAAYLILILLTGHIAAALRGWRSVAWAASAGAVIWALVNRGEPSAALLLLLSPAAAIAGVAWRRTQAPGDPAVLWDPQNLSLVVSALAALALWWGVPDHPVAAGLLLAGLTVLGGLAAALRLVPAPLQVAPYVATALAVLMVSGVVGGKTAEGDTLIAVNAALGFVLIGTGFAASLRALGKVERACAAAGAVAGAIVLALAPGGLEPIAAYLAWLVPLVGVVILCAAVVWFGRRSEAPGEDLALAVWIWSATFLAIRTLGAAFEPMAFAVSLAGLCVVCAILYGRLAWRGLASSTVAFAIATLVVLQSAAEPMLFSEIEPWRMAMIFLAATAGLWLAAFTVRRAGRDVDVADSLGMGALIAALIGGFLLLRLWAVASLGDSAGLDRLTQVGFQTLLILAAGLMSAQDPATAGRLGRIRPHLFIALGAAYGLAVSVMTLNPLWSRGGLPLKGPPIFDTLALAYLAPALLLAWAARSRISRAPLALSAYAAMALVFAVTWAGLEIRRLFQGVSFHGGLDEVGRAEAGAYGLLALAVAYGVSWAARLAERGAPRLAPFTSGIGVFAQVAAWTAALIAAFIFGYAASPWWGPIIRPFEDVGAVVLLLGLYAAGVGAWLLHSGQSLLGRLARAAAALQAFVLLTLVIRFGFRRLDMSTALQEARLETWVFSAAWALYGVAVLILGARRADAALRWSGLAILLFTTAKVFLFDMARLDGMVRAGSFLALGALLIAGALAARRFGGLGLALPDAPEKEPSLAK